MDDIPIGGIEALFVVHLVGLDTEEAEGLVVKTIFREDF